MKIFIIHVSKILKIWFWQLIPQNLFPPLETARLQGEWESERYLQAALLPPKVGTSTQSLPLTHVVEALLILHLTASSGAIKQNCFKAPGGLLRVNVSWKKVLWSCIPAPRSSSAYRALCKGTKPVHKRLGLCLCVYFTMCTHVYMQMYFSGLHIHLLICLSHSNCASLPTNLPWCHQ